MKGLLLSVLLCLGLPDLVASEQSAGKTPDRLNVVLISLDTVRPDHLSCYGYHRKTTPNIDRIAKDGALFTQAFSQAPTTFASHLSILTLQYPTGAWVRWELDDEERSAESLVEVLARHGYSAAAFTGFRKEGGWYKPLLASRAFQAFDSHVAPMYLRNPSNQLFAWLEEHGEQPFFLFIHGFDAHPPHVLPIQYEAKRFNPTYRGALPSTEAELYRAASLSPDELKQLSGDQRYNILKRTYLHLVSRPGGGVRAEDLEHLQAFYDAQLYYLDQGLEHVFVALNNLHLLARTLIVILSDHGLAFGEHGDYVRHARCYDEATHIVLIVRDPRLPRRGRRVRQLVQAIDVMPTILESLGLPVPSSARGRSLVPLLKAGHDPEREELAISIDQGLRAIRTPAWKLIDIADGSKELYQLAQDPREQRNVIDRYPEIAARLHTQLDARLPRSEAGPGSSEHAVQQMQGHGYW